MLSILIPTYNFNVYPLVCQIEKQAIESRVVFEIICIDDGSLSKFNEENEKINSLTNAKFISLKKNIGLSNNRNKLANASMYEYLLFIDGDSKLINKNFINKYLSIIDKNDIIYGGRVHPETVGANRRLRWKYGIHKEDLPPSQRNKNPYKCTLFNNTLIKKSVFNKIGFEKSITQYGHEDTVFSYNLFRINATIKHIDNPVLHTDVDLNSDYFNKTKKALENLNFIYKTGLIEPNFITFLKVFNKLKKFKLNYLFALNNKLFYSFFKYNLISSAPSLYLFELFRLSYFCHINLKK